VATVRAYRAFVRASGIELLPAGGHRTVTWRNGRGVTSEIVVEPAGDDWHWRLSIADVASSDDFSLFPGVDRTIVVVEGAGMALSIGDEPEQVVLPLQPLVFSGDEATSCRLLDGPVRDLNLMTRRATTSGRVDLVTLVAGSVLEGHDWTVLVVLSGSVECGGHLLERLDAVRARDASTRPVVRPVSGRDPGPCLAVVHVASHAGTTGSHSG